MPTNAHSITASLFCIYFSTNSFIYNILNTEIFLLLCRTTCIKIIEVAIKTDQGQEYIVLLQKKTVTQTGKATRKGGLLFGKHVLSSPLFKSNT